MCFAVLLISAHVECVDSAHSHVGCDTKASVFVKPCFVQNSTTRGFLFVRSE